MTSCSVIIQPILIGHASDAPDLACIEGSILDQALLERTFSAYRPEIVFHAAALKHLAPLEFDPFAALETNVFGTGMVADAARRWGVEQLVNVSTDKAVDPTSVLGVSKRIAELLLLSRSHSSCVVHSLRLGNVLGSSGSVVPIFLQALRRKLPLKITQPQASRYFITMDEAAGFLAQTLSIGQPSLLLPGMGSPLTICELAHFLAGKENATPMICIGLRDGEKHSEQLTYQFEYLRASTAPHIYEVCGNSRDGENFSAQPESLKRRGESSADSRNDGDAAGNSSGVFPQPDPAEAFMLTRKIAVVTSSRADYSHLYWVLRELSAQPNIELTIITMGPHLSPEFGHTAGNLSDDGFAAMEKIECLLSSDTDIGMAKTIGVATLGLADCLGKLRPDLILLIADRYEMLAPASVALALRIPIAHIEGGDVSLGAIDDAVRNALTKLAHVHFTTTESSRNRVINMGEEPWRVHTSGSPSLDHITRGTLLQQREIEARLKISLASNTIAVIYHPVTISRDTLYEADELFAALQDLPQPLLFINPNADAGSRKLSQRIRSFIEQRAIENRLNDTFIANIDHLTYLSLLQYLAAIVGNSSSGIMESGSFHLPAVNVGMRQKGRERGRNVD